MTGWQSAITSQQSAFMTDLIRTTQSYRRFFTLLIGFAESGRTFNCLSTCFSWNVSVGRILNHPASYPCTAGVRCRPTTGPSTLRPSGWYHHSPRLYPQPGIVGEASIFSCGEDYACPDPTTQ